MRVNWDPNQNVMNRAEELGQRSGASKEALQEAAEQFEALFLYQLLNEMRRTVPDSDLFGNRKAEKLFQSLLDQEVADHSVRAQSVGLAKLIYEQMSRYLPEQD